MPARRTPATSASSSNRAQVSRTPRRRYCEPGGLALERRGVHE